MANQQTLALIDVVTKHHVAMKRPADCALLLWLKEQGDRDPDVVRTELSKRSDWLPLFSYEALTVTKSPTAQAIYARALAAAPWKDARVLIERVFREGSIKLQQQAADILVARLAQSHPNPKAFLTRADVHASLAPGVAIDVSALRAPDFPALAHVSGRVSAAGITKR